MKLRGSLLVIICCLVVELCNISRKEYLLIATILYDRIAYFIGVGSLFLLYPLVGHLTDVYLTRYRSLKCSFVMQSVWWYLSLYINKYEDDVLIFYLS